MVERRKIFSSSQVESSKSESDAFTELPKEIREVFENTGYGCLAAETDIGVVHLCHAADNDIERFAAKPMLYQWQLIEMPTAPLLRFVVAILDQPQNPYRFESFLNIADETQSNILVQLARQDKLHLAFYGDDLSHHFTTTLEPSPQQWRQLDELVWRASQHWHGIPPEQRDFDQAKALFMNELLL